MQNQPYLHDFPLTLFATAKRKMQAAMRRTRAIVLRRSLSGYSVLFSEILPGNFLESIDPTKRQRSYGHLPVFWAWLAQILEANASCSKAVSLIQHWSRTNKLTIPASNTSSYCQARKRLKLSFLKNIHRRISKKLNDSIQPLDQWQGYNLKAMDGSSIQLMDTQQNQNRYPQPCGQKPGCGFPTMGIVGLLNLSHGGWEHLQTCPHTDHDSKAAAKLTQHLEQGDLLLADRAFCSYELIACSLTQGAEILMRLHQAREKALDWKKAKPISPHERLVTWKRPSQPAGSKLSPDEWQQLPKTLTLRLIRFGYENRQGNKARMVLVTSLTNYKNHPWQQVATLYHQRWDIELKLRDLKTTLRLEKLDVKSPKMAHKTLWMSVIAYNLVRYLMQQAAAQNAQPIWSISFKGVLDLINTSHENFRHYAATPRQKITALKQFIKICATKIINLRPYRKEPRAVKRRPKNYHLLTKPRNQFTEPPHRNRYSKPA